MPKAVLEMAPLDTSDGLETFGPPKRTLTSPSFSPGGASRPVAKRDKDDMTKGADIRRSVQFKDYENLVEVFQYKDPLTKDAWEVYRDAGVQVDIKTSESSAKFGISTSVRVHPLPLGRTRACPVLPSPNVSNIVGSWPTSTWHPQGSPTVDPQLLPMSTYREGVFALLGAITAQSCRESIRLAEESDRNKLPRTIEGVEFYMRKLDQAQEQRIREEALRHKLKPPKATFDMLSMLFKPGVFVYTTIEGSEVAGIVKLVAWEQGKSGANAPYMKAHVRMWYLDYSGSYNDMCLPALELENPLLMSLIIDSYIKRRKHTVVVDRYNGERAISDLPIYPEAYAKDRTLRRKHRISRGEKFLDLAKQGSTYRNYTGSLSQNLIDPYLKQDHRPVSVFLKVLPKASLISFQYQGNVIVDPDRYCREKGCDPFTLWEDDWDDIQTEQDDKMNQFVKLDLRSEIRSLDDNHKFLLPQWIRGFTLGPRGPRDWGKGPSRRSEQLLTLSI